MSDPLIDRLINDLTPTEPLRNTRLWQHCALCLVLMAAAVLAIMGLRADYAAAAWSGALFWKSGVFLLITIAGILMMAALSRPAGRVRLWHLMPLLGGLALLGAQLALSFSNYPASAVQVAITNPTIPFCIGIISIGGLMMLGLLWRFWLSRTASSNPGRLGFLAGLASGSMAAAAYALHCDQDTGFYVTIYYGAPLMALALLGHTLGRRKLGW